MRENGIGAMGGKFCESEQEIMGGKLMENRGYFSKICLQTHLRAVFFMTIKLPQEQGLHFSQVSAFTQIREDLKRFLSASVDSHLPPAQHNHSKVTSQGQHIPVPFKSMLSFSQYNLGSILTVKTRYKFFSLFFCNQQLLATDPLFHVSLVFPNPCYEEVLPKV